MKFVDLTMACKCSVFLFFLLGFGNLCSAQLSGYSFGKEITVDATKVSGSSALTDFPMLINVTDLSLRSIANGGNVQNSNGYDIVFTSSSCGGFLDHEIESYDEATGEYIAWIRIPSLDNSINTIIQMYYGNSSISSDPSTSSVWSSNYENVYHMSQDPSGSAPQMTESTANGRDATSHGTMTTGDLVGAQIGNGIALDGTDDQFTSASTSASTRTVTWSVWINLNGSANDFDGLFYDGGGVNIMSDNTVRAAWNGAWSVATTATVTPSQWSYVAVVINGDTPAGDNDDFIYVGNSGTISTFQYNSFDFWTYNDFSSFRIGNQNCCGGRFLNATLDEARFITSTLSADWVATEYNNQYSPSTFYSISAEMNAGDLCATLPIELLDFKVENHQNNYIELRWSTLTETNNDYFIIERSSNGKTFEEIGQVDGGGTSKSVLKYSYEDKSPLRGTNYYRIKQVDFDGTYDYTRTETSSFGSKIHFKLSPNPVIENLEIIGKLQKGTYLKIQNLSGVLVEAMTIESDSKNINLSMRDLPNGIYVLTILADTYMERIKFLKQ